MWGLRKKWQRVLFLTSDAQTRTTSTLTNGITQTRGPQPSTVTYSGPGVGKVENHWLNWNLWLRSLRAAGQEMSEPTRVLCLFQIVCNGGCALDKIILLMPPTAMKRQHCYIFVISSYGNREHIRSQLRTSGASFLLDIQQWGLEHTAVGSWTYSSGSWTYSSGVLNIQQWGLEHTAVGSWTYSSGVWNIQQWGLEHTAVGSGTYSSGVLNTTRIRT